MTSNETLPTPEQYTLETPCIEDASVVAKLMESVWVSTYENEDRGITASWLNAQAHKFTSPAGVAMFAQDIAEAHAHPEKQYYRVARSSEGELVGFMHGAKIDDDTCKAYSLYVAKEYQGRGAGTYLLGDFLEWAGEDSTVYLDVATYNFRAMKLYGNKFGFGLVPKSKDLLYEKIPVVTLKREGRK